MASLIDHNRDPFRIDSIFFKWMTGITCACINFASLCLVIGVENSRHFLNQSDSKVITISYAPGSTLAFTLTKLELYGKFYFEFLTSIDLH